MACIRLRATSAHLSMPQLEVVQSKAAVCWNAAAAMQ